MLKRWSIVVKREKMSKINLLEVIENVVEDFRQDLKNQNKKHSN